MSDPYLDGLKHDDLETQVNNVVSGKSQIALIYLNF